MDPKFLNKALKCFHYIMLTLKDILYKLPKARIFTLVDAKHAFLQCKLDQESSFMTIFWTPWGRKRWLKLPFGVSVAPEVYQRKQHELLAGLKLVISLSLAAVTQTSKLKIIMISSFRPC